MLRRRQAVNHDTDLSGSYTSQMYFRCATGQCVRRVGHGLGPSNVWGQSFFNFWWVGLGFEKVTHEYDQLRVFGPFSSLCTIGGKHPTKKP